MNKEDAIVGTIVCFDKSIALPDEDLDDLLYLVIKNHSNDPRIGVVWHKGHENEFASSSHMRMFLPANLAKCGGLSIDEMLTHRNSLCRKAALKLLHIDVLNTSINKLA